MKKLIAIILVVSFQQAVAADPVTLNAKIDAVTVYLNGAQVYRKTKTTVVRGTSKIIIDDISPYINPKSIQATLSGSPLILDVKHNIHYNTPDIIAIAIPEKIQQQIYQLEDSILFKGFELEEVRARLNNLKNEKRFIMNNKTMRGEGRSDSLPILIQAVEFYRTKLTEIEEQLVISKIKEHKLSKHLEKVNVKLSSLRDFSVHTTAKEKKPKERVHQIILTVNATEATTSTININYLVDRAGWVPSYDLRASDEASPVNLTYKASIYQKTGEDWNDVKLTLSTFNQECSFSIPTISKWELFDKTKLIPVQVNRNNFAYESITDSVLLIQNGYSNVHMPTKDLTRSLLSSTNNGLSHQLNSQSNTTFDEDFSLPKSLISNTDEALSNVEFNIKSKYSIPADGEEILLVVMNEDINSSFDHITVPKVNTDAFLLANITDWQQLNLLPAIANIYFNNSFVGETAIQPATLEDTLVLAVGRERNIHTSRKKVKDEEKLTTIGKHKVRTITIELVVKNSKSTNAMVKLKDQIPVSKDKEIKIKVLDHGGAQLDDNTGLLSWRLNLAPKETKIVVFTYEVEYEKEADVL